MIKIQVWYSTNIRQKIILEFQIPIHLVGETIRNLIQAEAIVRSEEEEDQIYFVIKTM